MKEFTLIKTKYSHHVSMDLYHEFEGEILKSGKWDFVNGPGNLRARIGRQLLKFMPVLRFPMRSKRNFVAIGYQVEKFFPYFHLKANSKTLWMYDAWEPLFKNIEKTVRDYGINLLCTASKQSADHFNSLGIENFRCEWLPEGVDSDLYRFVPYADRNIDVLQLGRKWDDYHDKIKPLEGELVYKYEKKRGQIIFATREEFLNGLANAKISICVPSDITHPERSGNISTITNRYLQSMASRCLILGKAPGDMKFVFDYDPMIEIDETDPIGQIRDILKNYDDYIPLIEKNYETVRQFHHWRNRVQQLENLIKQK
jgi:hypothetical protein